MSKKYRIPFIIEIEGLDGTGKETTAYELQRKLTDEGFATAVISFPMHEKWHSKLVRMMLNGMFGKNPKKLPPKLISTFYAFDRMIAWHFYIKKELDKCDVIIFDRYTGSNQLYQGGKIYEGDVSSEIDATDYARWNTWLEHGLCGLPHADIVLLLDANSDISQTGMKDRTSLDIHERDKSFLDNVYNWSRKLAINFGWEVISIFDEVTRERLSPEDLVNKIYRNHIKSKFTSLIKKAWQKS